jgi:hypothetical protein
MPAATLGARTMLEYLNQKLAQLVDTVLAPLWRRLIAASIAVKLLLLVVIGLTTLAIAHPEGARRIFVDGANGLQVLRAAQGAVPIPGNTRESMKGVVTRLSTTTTSDLINLAGGYMTPWSTAQSAVATVAAKASFDRVSVTNFIHSREAPGCACWTELPGQAEPEQHVVFISGWVLAALADMDVAASTDALHYALAQQHKDGSWSSLEVGTDEAYSSTYATAWLLIGLKRQSDARLVPAQDQSVVASAVTRAAAWLLSHRAHGARWKAYPNMTDSVESESISGVALHALHLAVPTETPEIDRAWLRSLPDGSTAADAMENYDVEIRSGQQRRGVDHFVQLKLPWMMIATVDAFGNGSLPDRAAALNWIDASLDDRTVHDADKDTNNWWRSELLYSLAYLLARG